MKASDITISLPDGGVLPAYFAPAAGGQADGIVLLQEIFGVNANMRAIADDYAAQGLNVIVPDLFWRQQAGLQLDPAEAADRERATALLHGLDQTLAVDDASAAGAYLRTLAGGTHKIAAVGYCIGGKLAYLLASRGAVDAAVSYYGVAIQSQLDKAPQIQVPLLLHIAGDDHLCPPEAQAAIAEAVAGRPNISLMRYPEVGHAFARRGSSAYRADAAERADAATATFLSQILNPGTST